MTRMRVLRREAELIPAKFAGRKSNDQRKPSGDATPRSLSLQINVPRAMLSG